MSFFDLGKLEDTSVYYKDIVIGKLRNYGQRLWNTNYTASKITDQIYISDLASSCNKERLMEDGITHILTALIAVEPYFPDNFVYKSLPVSDYHRENLERYFDECYEFIDEVVEGGGKVLVHCAYGVSRSATIVIAYLIKKYGVTYDKAYEKVKHMRDVIEPNEGFKRQLRGYSDKYAKNDGRLVDSEEISLD